MTEDFSTSTWYNGMVWERVLGQERNDNCVLAVVFRFIIRTEIRDLREGVCNVLFASPILITYELVTNKYHVTSGRGNKYRTITRKKRCKGMLFPLLSSSFYCESFRWKQRLVTGERCIFNRAGYCFRSVFCFLEEELMKKFGNSS